MTFDYPGCAVHYELEGPADGAPILMLHGFGCELALMRGCMEPAVRAADHVRSPRACVGTSTAGHTRDMRTARPVQSDGVG